MVVLLFGCNGVNYNLFLHAHGWVKDALQNESITLQVKKEGIYGNIFCEQSHLRRWGMTETYMVLVREQSFPLPANSWEQSAMRADRTWKRDALRVINNGEETASWNVVMTEAWKYCNSKFCELTFYWKALFGFYWCFYSVKLSFITAVLGKMVKVLFLLCWS